MSGARPLSLVSYNHHSNRFEVGEDALAVLRGVKSPLGVVAVCGRARQGKSYILNQLVSKGSKGGDGFRIGSTHRPCTKGLWMWSEPLRHEGADGSESFTVLLDTEGIDAYDQTAQYSTQIFSLAVLLSCLFVYNHMGGIDESALDRLSLVTEMTKHVRVRAGQAKEGDLDSLSEFAPSFLWLLRDFYLKLEEDGRKITAGEYLETALHPVAGEGPSVASKNEIRGSIKALFKDRDCFSLVRPMNDEMALANLESVPKDQLRPEFTSGVKKLVELIFSKSKPKRFGNGLMSGPVLAGLVQAYVDAINKGAVPTIATAWQGVAESESRRASDLAEATYKQNFDAAIVADETALMAEHQRCLALAVATFKDVSVGDESIRKAHEAKFLESVHRYYNDFSGRKLAEAASHVNELLYKANLNMNKAVRQGNSLESMQDDLSTFIEDFVANTHGPTKWEKLAEFLKEAYPAMANEAISKAQASNKGLVEQLQVQLEEAREQMRTLEERLTQAEQLNTESNTSMLEVQSQLAAAQQEVEGLRAELHAKTGHVAALESQLDEIAQSSERRVTAAEQEAEARISAMEADTNRQISDMQSLLSSEQLRAQGVQSDLSARSARMAAVEQQVDSLNSEVTEWRTRYHGAVEERVKMMQERDAARDELAALQIKHNSSSNQHVAATLQLQELQARMKTEERYKAEVQARLDAMIEEARKERFQGQVARSGTARHAAQTALAFEANGENEEEELGDATPVGDAYARMSIQEIKDQLTQRGAEEAVFDLQNRKPGPKKTDWVQLLKDVPVA